MAGYWIQQVAFKTDIEVWVSWFTFLRFLCSGVAGFVVWVAGLVVWVCQFGGLGLLVWWSGVAGLVVCKCWFGGLGWLVWSSRVAGLVVFGGRFVGLVLLVWCFESACFVVWSCRFGCLELWCGGLGLLVGGLRWGFGCVGLLVCYSRVAGLVV